ncbi:hypothetical protein F4782DRAFT_483308 [Xylaria castorea]|nr:hypothetical protein F4782DRAFT_483308 [Xylaria castorea]
MSAQLVTHLTGLIDLTTRDELLLMLWGSVSPTKEDLRCMQSYFDWLSWSIIPSL